MKLTVPSLPRRSRTWTVFAIHAVLAALAYALAFLLRFDFSVPADEWYRAARTLPALLVLQTGALGALGVHRGSWRHVGLHDLLALAAAALAATGGFVVMLVLIGYLPGVPRSVVVLNALLFVALAGGTRLTVRCLHEGRFRATRHRGRRTLLIGAGEAAERFLRQSSHAGHDNLRVVGLLDDNVRLHGMSIHGVPVLGSVDEVRELAAAREVALLVIAIPSARGEQVRRIVRLCTEAAVEFKILPSLRELIDGTAQVGQLRDVQLEDLLGRAPVHLDLGPVRRELAGATVLISGGAGSIGSELARQIASLGPARIVLLEQAESPLYFTHLELSKAFPDVEVIPVLGDITSTRRTRAVFRAYPAAYVFHAAAYKHVPMAEENPAEAVRNNVLGTLQLAECAACFGAEKFILISTDKAVNPSSVMGATKRLAELIILGWPSLRDSSTDFRAVRFGNVLGSDGSVVPLFKRQLAAGGPITITHRDVRRYFMTIPESVELVLQAAALPAARNRIAMLDMGSPVRILDLAEQLIRLSGLTPYQDVQVVFTGLRPGEKLDEELTSVLEASAPTDLEMIRLVHTHGAHGATLREGVRRLMVAANREDRRAIIRALHALVPEYGPWRPTHEHEMVVDGRRPVGIPADVPRSAVRTPFDVARGAGVQGLPLPATGSA